MSIYLSLYLIVILALLHIWLLVYKQYREFLYGKYLIVGIISFTIWISLYLFIFSFTPQEYMLLIASRLLYFLSLLGGYCIVFFAYFFSSKKTTQEKYKKINIYIIIALWIVGIITLFSPYIIKDMIYNDNLLHYYEEFWSLFNIYAILYILNPLAFIIIARRKIKLLNWVSKTRLRYISTWYLIFILNWITFLWIFPMFNIWVLQKEQVIFFVPFIVSIYYSIHRYHFLDPFIWAGRAFIFINSILFSALFTHKIYDYYASKIWSKFAGFWWIDGEFWLVHISIWILVFCLTYNFLTKKLLIGGTHSEFVEKLEKIKERIPFITNINDLNMFLKHSFNNFLNISNTHIELFNEKSSVKSEIHLFFEDNIKNMYFLNDIVFIEENKHKFHKEKLKHEIGTNISLILPIKRQEKDISGILILGHKPLKDIYTISQITELEKFTRFLTGHIKYLGIYQNIHELNINLDKKVDEKTMEYNNLISKQREFISVVSHEMRSPLTTAIFQADCILDDVKDGENSRKYLEKEIGCLYSQLVRASELVKKLFSVEKYDINKFSLFKEEVDIWNFLEKEIAQFKKNNKGVKFETSIWSDLGMLKIDQVQFRQAIDNLINNALKFAKKDASKILITAENKWYNIQISIEDNWEWFKDTDIKNIFDKYSTWKTSWIGIGIGLYLCKKIVELHWGRIQADFSENLGWAKFVIKLPK